MLCAKIRISLFIGIIAVSTGLYGQSLDQQREALFAALRQAHGLSEQQIDDIEAIFAGSTFLGQGNPAVTRHPATSDECLAQLDRAALKTDNQRFEPLCGAPYMVPLYEPGSEAAQEATSCIDRFEFPNIPCQYPVVWVRAQEAARICQAMGKRLCDAHEWEGACEGRPLPPDYDFKRVARMPGADAVKTMRRSHNRQWSSTKTWAYGEQTTQAACATGSHKNPACNGGDWDNCGSNTYPVGMFPGCDSPLGVSDLHGNVAEHMNLPTRETELASRGDTLGHTEMKGSWFIWDEYPAHQDWCRWRAPYWHGSRVMSGNSHRNYHLGFRCCKSITP